MKMKLSLLLCLFLLTACTDQSSNHLDDPVDENEHNVQGDDSNYSGDGEEGSNVEIVQEEAYDKLPLKAFFMKNGTVAHFKGEGQKFATYTLRTQFLYDNYVNEYQESEGNIMIRTYRIEEDQVLLLRAEVESQEYNPGKLELDSLKPIQVYLKYPLEKGVEFDSWIVIDTEASLSTPYKDFENVIVLEYHSEDTTIYQKYLVEGMGTVRFDIIMPRGTNEPNISSILESIE